MPKDAITKIKEELKKIPTYYIRIGVFSGDTERKKVIEEYDLSLTSIEGITNAELMFIHENGSPVRHIPPRPVLKLTIEHANKELVKPAMVKGATKYLQTGNIKELEKELNRLCVRMESYARWIIRRSNLLHKLKDRTIKEKNKRHKGEEGEDASQPLLDTGQLADSIRCVLVSKV